jgi:H+/Cl- antiporter ClcA
MAVVAATADAYLAAVAMYIELTDGPQNVEVFRRLALELLASTIDDMLKATEDM